MEEVRGFVGQLLEIDGYYQDTMGSAYGTEIWGAGQFLAERPLKWELSQFAWRGSRLVGFWIASRTSLLVCQIHRVAVEASHRRTGIAQALYTQFSTAATRLGLREATLEVTNANREAIGFYGRQGFGALDGEALARYAAEKGRAAIVRQSLLVEPSGVSCLVMRRSFDDGAASEEKGVKDQA